MPDHTENKSRILFTCNSDAIRLKVRYIKTPNTVTYRKTGRNIESTMLAKNESINKEGKK